ncbi:hypothetical protein SAMN05216551_101183 [Chitinasiproducens palmae]|uniref:Alpha/beta hydrolase n=1 Tax=Chitinasiproducens palmae TaxID=1770053 RepID=A0A1H2PJ37_9BURK|nr:alpha/beta hydrolase [Chitinasiproducens palmae]SDV46225.1 hypothetical protein SAMN05216551_101183 [Chitinasiproducens palmae]
MVPLSTVQTALLVTVPGLRGSGEGHWQTWLEGQFERSTRVQQRDWAHPELDEWAQQIVRTVAAAEEPVVLVAHSFGCLATARALADLALPAVRGVLFVAPARPERFAVQVEQLAGRLTCPSIVVGSENDPWMPLNDARALAQRWGSSFLNYGLSGHINTEAGFGPWEMGRQMILSLMHCARPARSEAPAHALAA